MKSTLGAAVALFALVATVPASAQPTGPEPAEPMAAAVQPTSPDECVFDGETPTMPDPKTATKDDVKATFDAIKAYQTALIPYRECLNAIIDNKDLEAETRQAALDKFNGTVDEEEALVKAWAEFYSAYKENRDGKDS